MEREPADGCESSEAKQSNMATSNEYFYYTPARPNAEGSELAPTFTDNSAGNREAAESNSESLRCSSLQIEEVQKRRSRMSNGYPGLAFGAPMYSNTIFKFALIANEIKDLKQNQLKKAESEVTNLSRKVQFIEEDLEKSEERLKITLQKLNEAHQAAEESERIRKTLENKTNLEDDRISFLENELAQARQIAEESDKKYEDMARRIAMLETDLEKAEEKATKFEQKNTELENELKLVGHNLKSLEANGEKAQVREEVFEQQIKLLNAKLKEAEARAELAERTVQKLQSEVDRLEDDLSGEREKSHLLQEEVETTLKDLQGI